MGRWLVRQIFAGAGWGFVGLGATVAALEALMAGRPAGLLIMALLMALTAWSLGRPAAGAGLLGAAAAALGPAALA